MLSTDVSILVCPACEGELSLTDATDQQDDVIEGTLTCRRCGNHFPIQRGIPRFVQVTPRQKSSWNYKWTAIDRGRGLNHLILDKNDPAYELHDIYDRNSHGGRAFRAMRGGRAIEVGCGVGQYVIKSLLQFEPAKIVALDLTEGVDTLREIVLSKYPHLLSQILFVQASVFAMPFKPASFDYVYSLGVLHHTGDTTRAIRAAADLVREGGSLNIWIYAAATYHVDTRESGRQYLSRWPPLLRIVFTRFQARAWYRLFAVLSTRQADRLLRPFSSHTWYAMSRLPVVRILTRLIMSPPPHPNRDYRHLNLFDGYVNSWAENWSEAELFPILRDCGIAIKGISDWRLGVWGIKDTKFYSGTCS